MAQPDVGEVVLFGHDKHVAQHFGMMETGVAPVYQHFTLGGAQHAADEIEQGRLARAVLAQEAVDVVLFQLEAEVLEYLVLGARVSEVDVVDLYHILNISCFIVTEFIVFWCTIVVVHCKGMLEVPKYKDITLLFSVFNIKF